MFNFQRGRNICQAKDILDAVTMVRWVLENPSPQDPVGKYGNLHWFREQDELTVMIKNGVQVSSVLNIKGDYSAYLTQLSSRLFNGHISHSLH